MHQPRCELADGLLATICKCNGHRYRGLEERHVSEMPMLCGFVSRNSIPYGPWMLGLCLHVLRILICHLVSTSVNATASRLYIGFLIQCHLYPLIVHFVEFLLPSVNLIFSGSVTCNLLCVNANLSSLTAPWRRLRVLYSRVHLPTLAMRPSVTDPLSSLSVSESRLSESETRHCLKRIFHQRSESWWMGGEYLTMHEQLSSGSPARADE